ncbi:MAG: hypothetical protein WC976_00525 [Caldisericia bacterium]
MTRRRIQFAEAVDALRRGEEPKDVFRRLGYELGPRQLEAACRRLVEEAGHETPQ